MKHLSIIIKLILFLSIITSINNHLWHIAGTNIFLLILTFTPQILKKSTNIKFPKQFEILILIFVILTLTLGKIKGIIAPMIFGIGTGLIALLILLILYSSNKIKKNYFLILTYSFCFSMTFATTLEMLKYYLKKILHHELNSGIYLSTMNNLTYVLIGAAIATSIGLFYMKTHFSFLEKIINKMKKSNPDIFKKTNSLKEIIEELKQGESITQEFKSTLRTNLHTNQSDKKIENSVLKTLTAFLNTTGGILYIGITDNIKVLGIEKDRFPNTDKFELHLTNLIKQKINKKYLSLIKIKTIQVKDRHITRIECKKSKSPIFLKDGKEEHFFIRIGPQTTELKASELIDYVKKRFNKK